MLPDRLNLFRTARRRDALEHGAAAIEAVIIVPLILLIIFAILQGALWFQAGAVAQAAATTAYNQARAYKATPATGIVAGDQFLQSHPGNITGGNVNVNIGATQVTVTVTGTSAALIPFLRTDVSRTVTGPVERWVQP